MFKKSIFFLFLLGFILPLHAQEIVLDSLKTELSKNPDAKQKVVLLRNIGFYFQDTQTQYDSAFFYAQKAYSVAKENGLDLEQGQALFDMGIIMDHLGSSKKAIEYYEQSLPFTQKADAKVGLAITYHNIGSNYSKTKEYDKALSYFEKSFAIDTVFPELEAASLVNIGEIYYLQKKYEQAVDHILRGKKKYAEIPEIGQEPEANLYLARAYWAKGNKKMAVEEAEEGLTIAKNKGDLQQVYELGLFLSKGYDTLGDYASGYKNLQTAIVYKDSISGIEMLNEVEKLELKVKIKEQNSALDKLKQKNKYLTTIYILAGIGLILLIVLVFRQLKISRMTKAIHDIQNRLIKSELDLREQKNKTSFDATVWGDRQLKK